MSRLTAALMVMVTTLFLAGLAGPVLAQAEFLTTPGTGFLGTLGFAARKEGPGPDLLLGFATSSRFNLGFHAAHFNSHPSASAYSAGGEFLILKGQGARSQSIGIGGTFEILNLDGREYSLRSLQLSLINNLRTDDRLKVQSVVTVAYVAGEQESRSAAIQFSIPIVLRPKSGHSPYIGLSAAASNHSWVIAVRAGILFLWPRVSSRLDENEDWK
jgi:hypothetical protein